jgi:thymidylate synthase
MWPKQAAYEDVPDQGLPKERFQHWGIRYGYGDLMDVMYQLAKNPWTRQAYLPIWFPEDTGAVMGQRVPCTLGYHFLYRRERMDIVYYIRSCDLLRHFTDDVYMAARLCQWVSNMLEMHLEIPVTPGDLVMHISSLHIFRGDYEMVKYKVNKWIHPEEDDEIYGAAV